MFIFWWECCVIETFWWYELYAWRREHAAVASQSSVWQSSSSVFVCNLFNISEDYYVTSPEKTPYPMPNVHVFSPKTSPKNQASRFPPQKKISCASSATASRFRIPGSRNQSTHGSTKRSDSPICLRSSRSQEDLKTWSMTHLIFACLTNRIFFCWFYMRRSISDGFFLWQFHYGKSPCFFS